MLARLETERAEAEAALGTAAPLPVGVGPGTDVETAQCLGVWLAAHEIVWASLPSFTGFWSLTAPACYGPMCATDELGSVAENDETFGAHFPTAARVVKRRRRVWGERVVDWGLVPVVLRDAMFGEGRGAVHARTEDGDVIVFATSK